MMDEVREQAAALTLSAGDWEDIITGASTCEEHGSPGYAALVLTSYGFDEGTEWILDQAPKIGSVLFDEQTACDMMDGLVGHIGASITLDAAVSMLHYFAAATILQAAQQGIENPDVAAHGTCMVWALALVDRHPEFIAPILMELRANRPRADE